MPQTALPPPPAGYSLDSLPPPPAGYSVDSGASKPEGLLAGWWNTVKGAVAGAAQLSNPFTAADASAAMIASHAEQVIKAKQAHDKGHYTEAVGHLLAAGVPGVGPAAAQIGEEAAGTEATYDKYGNVVKPATPPNPAGATGRAAGLATIMAAPEVIPRVAEAIPPAVDAVAAIPGKVVAAAKTPGNLKIAGGAAATAGAVPMFAHEPLAAVYTAGKGIKAIAEGLAERRAAGAAGESVGGHEIGFLNDIAGESFLKLSPDKQAGILNIADRLDKPVPADLQQVPEGYHDPNYRISTPPYDPNAPAGRTIGDVAREELTRPAEPTDDQFRAQYQHAVKPEAEAFLERYNRAVKNPPAGPDTGPAPDVPLLKPGAAPAAPAAAAPPAEPGPPLARPDVAARAQALADEMRRNGYEPPAAGADESVGFADKGRTARQANVKFIQDNFAAMSKMTNEELVGFAKQHGVDFPAGKAAQFKLIQEALSGMK